MEINYKTQFFGVDYTAVHREIHLVLGKVKLDNPVGQFYANWTIGQVGQSENPEKGKVDCPTYQIVQHAQLSNWELSNWELSNMTSQKLKKKHDFRPKTNFY